MLLDHSLSLSPSLSLPGKRCRAVQPHTPRANAPLQFMGAHASPPPTGCFHRGLGYTRKDR